MSFAIPSLTHPRPLILGSTSKYRRELLTRLGPIEFGEPDLLHSNFVHGVKRLPAHIG